MGRFSVDFEVANYRDVIDMEKGTLAPAKVRRVQLRGVVDPGATRLVLPASVVKRLGLPVTSKIKVRYADGRKGTRDLVDDAYVELLGRRRNFAAIVEPKRTSALIGAIVLEDLDFIVDCTLQKLVPRDPRFIVSEVE